MEEDANFVSYFKPQIETFANQHPAMYPHPKKPWWRAEHEWVRRLRSGPKSLLKKFWLIVLVGLIVSVIGFVYSIQMPMQSPFYNLIYGGSALLLLAVGVVFIPVAIATLVLSFLFDFSFLFGKKPPAFLFVPKESPTFKRDFLELKQKISEWSEGRYEFTKSLTVWKPCPRCGKREEKEYYESPVCYDCQSTQ